jgi:hypothetical protein
VGSSVLGTWLGSRPAHTVALSTQNRYTITHQAIRIYKDGRLNAVVQSILFSNSGFDRVKLLMLNSIFINYILEQVESVVDCVLHV